MNKILGHIKEANEEAVGKKGKKIRGRQEEEEKEMKSKKGESDRWSRGGRRERLYYVQSMKNRSDYDAAGNWEAGYGQWFEREISITYSLL